MSAPESKVIDLNFVGANSSTLKHGHFWLIHFVTENMANSKKQPTRLELYKAGKIEERHSIRPSHVPVNEVKTKEPDDEGIKLRPELIIIGVVVIIMLVLVAVGF